MKKALIVYLSKTGTTKKYAHEISTYLQLKQINTKCIPIEEYHEKLVQDIDFLLLGCWTKGLYFFFQKPDKIYNDFASSLIIENKTKITFFTTYKLTTGVMFKKMAKFFRNSRLSNLTNLKSRDGKLTKENKLCLDEFIQF